MRHVVLALAPALTLTGCSLNLGEGGGVDESYQVDARPPPPGDRCLGALAVQAYPAWWRLTQTVGFDNTCPIELRTHIDMFVSGIGADGSVVEAVDPGLEVDPVIRVPQIGLVGCEEYDRFDVIDRVLVGGVEVPVSMGWELVVTDGAAGQTIHGVASGIGPGTCQIRAQLSGNHEYGQM